MVTLLFPHVNVKGGFHGVREDACDIEHVFKEYKYSMRIN